MTVTAGPNMPINLRGGQDAAGDNIGIDTEFGDQSGTDPISDYYAGAASGFVPAGTVNGAGNAIPASGAVKWSDYYGAVSSGMPSLDWNNPTVPGSVGGGGYDVLKYDYNELYSPGSGYSRNGYYRLTGSGLILSAAITASYPVSRTTKGLSWVDLGALAKAGVLTVGETYTIHWNVVQWGERGGISPDSYWKSGTQRSVPTVNYFAAKTRTQDVDIGASWDLITNPKQGRPTEIDSTNQNLLPPTPNTVRDPDIIREFTATFTVKNIHPSVEPYQRSGQQAIGGPLIMLYPDNWNVGGGSGGGSMTVHILVDRMWMTSP